MSSDRSTDLVLDAATRLKKAEMDRRQLFLRSLAFGAGAAAGAAGISLGTRTASAQVRVPSARRAEEPEKRFLSARTEARLTPPPLSCDSPSDQACAHLCGGVQQADARYGPAPRRR